MFIDEAALCGRLSHPNLVQTHEFGVHDGQYFMAMEYVQGWNLIDIMVRVAAEGRRLPITVAAEIVRQVCRGLAYAHGLTGADGTNLGVIHRDISPANVIVSPAGVVKVLDFGVARVTDSFRLGTTEPGWVKGKTAYLAPEQLTQAPQDHRTDIFSAGILLHELLTGRRLFKAASMAETVQRITETPIPAVSRFNPTVPARLEAIVMRALRRKPAERYPSAVEMADALESFMVERRFSPKDLPQFLGSLFSKDPAPRPAYFSREELQALAADAQTQAPGGPEAEVELDLELEEVSLLAYEAPLDQLPSHVVADADIVAAVALERPSRRPRLRSVAALGGAVVLVAAVAVWKGRSAVVAPPVRPIAAALASAPAPALAPEAPAAAMSPASPAQGTFSKVSSMPTALRPTGGETWEPAPAASPHDETDEERTNRRLKREGRRVKHAVPVDPFAE